MVCCYPVPTQRYSCLSLVKSTNTLPLFTATQGDFGHSEWTQSGLNKVNHYVPLSCSYHTAMADPIGHVEGEATSAFPTTAPLPSGTYPGSGALSPSGPPMPVPSVLRASPGMQQRPPMYPYPGMWFGGIHTMPTGQNQPPLWYPFPPYSPMGYPPMGYPHMGMRPPQPEAAESQVGVSSERPPGEEEPQGNPPAFQPWQMPMPYYPGYPVPPHGFAPPGMPYTGHQ